MWLTKIAAVVSLLVMSRQVGASVSASVNLKIGVTVAYMGERNHEKKFPSCNVTGGWTEPLGFSPDILEGAIEGDFKTPSIRTADLYATRQGDGTHTPFLVRHLRFAYGQSITKTRETASVEISEDKQNFSVPEFSTHNGPCDTEKYYTRPNSPTTLGTVIVKYRVPANVWMVRVQVVGPKGSFASAADDKMGGSLIEGTTPTSSSSPRSFYVAPGTMLTKIFTFGSQHTGTVVTGAYSITFSPVTFAAASFSLERLRRNMENELDGSNITSDAREALLYDLMSTVQGRGEFERGLSLLPTYTVGALARSEFDLANSPLTGPLSVELRAAAALASFRTAFYLLKVFGPFCQIVREPVPPSSTLVRVRGLTYAYYTYTRAIKLLEGFDSAPYRTIVEELVSDEQKGLTVASVRSDRTRVKAFTTAYSILADMSADQAPFGGAEELLAELMRKFRTFGNGGADAKNLLHKLDAVMQANASLKQHILQRLRQFDSDAQQDCVVRGSDLRDELLRFEKDLSSLRRGISHNQHLLTVTQKGADDTVLYQIGRLLVFNVNILREPYTGGAKGIEPLRLAFMNQEDLDREGHLYFFLDSMEACLLGEGE